MLEVIEENHFDALCSRPYDNSKNVMGFLILMVIVILESLRLSLKSSVL